ncbi:MAG: hypothetical protein ABSC64_19715 [Candidatus Korobacteraceae bacterium]|jgi:hypothetical protein
MNKKIKIVVLAMLALLVLVLTIRDRPHNTAGTALQNPPSVKVQKPVVRSEPLAAWPDKDAKHLLLRQVELSNPEYHRESEIIMIASFTIKNPTGLAFKDFEITCQHFSPSGTNIDSNTRTIYEVVKANSTKRIRNFNMGFVNSQTVSSSCGITNLVPIGWN